MTITYVYNQPTDAQWQQLEKERDDWQAQAVHFMKEFEKLRQAHVALFNDRDARCTMAVKYANTLMAYQIGLFKASQDHVLTSREAMDSVRFTHSLMATMKSDLFPEYQATTLGAVES